WTEKAVRVEPGFSLGHLTTYVQWQAQAADAINSAILREGKASLRLRPILSQAEPVGSTGRVSFTTKKHCLVADEDKCEVSHIVLDGDAGNTWEQLLAAYASNHRDVAAYVKNDHLGFEIPYVHEGKRRDYVPDYLLRLRRRTTDPLEPDRTLIVEVSGGQKRMHTPGLVDLKVVAARETWCVAVNNHGGFGRWAYLEVTDPLSIQSELDVAIESLYAGGPICGDPDSIDIEERR
ncbi:MAG: hypothetical protein J2O46_06260, partial [Nocardioides sp.]|nr:hypothetical protein [Nocardioides sp.]